MNFHTYVMSFKSQSVMGGIIIPLRCWLQDLMCARMCTCVYLLYSVERVSINFYFLEFLLLSGMGIKFCQRLSQQLCSWLHYILHVDLFFLKILIYLFLETGEGKEKERERNINVWLPLTHPILGTWPTTQACAPTRTWTGDPLVHRPALSPLRHTKQGSI